jgi:hypothetical protein
MIPTYAPLNLIKTALVHQIHAQMILFATIAEEKMTKGTAQG